MAAALVGVATGAANVASVTAAFERLGAPLEWSNDPSTVAGAGALVLPGVGTYAAAMERLAADELVEPLRERIAAGRPTLAVCLGLQLLGTSSEESPGVAGLGVFDAPVGRLRGELPVPHMGWNRITAQPGCTLLEDSTVYFANSYRLASVPGGWSGATVDYGERFVAAIERGTVLACQFHPELSGSAGASLLSRWLEKARVPSC